MNSTMLLYEGIIMLLPYTFVGIKFVDFYLLYDWATDMQI